MIIWPFSCLFKSFLYPYAFFPLGYFSYDSFMSTLFHIHLLLWSLNIKYTDTVCPEKHKEKNNSHLCEILAV